MESIGTNTLRFDKKMILMTFAFGTLIFCAFAWNLLQASPTIESVSKMVGNTFIPLPIIFFLYYSLGAGIEQRTKNRTNREMLVATGVLMFCAFISYNAFPFTFSFAESMFPFFIVATLLSTALLNDALYQDERIAGALVGSMVGIGIYCLFNLKF